MLLFPQHSFRHTSLNLKTLYCCSARIAQSTGISIGAPPLVNKTPNSDSKIVNVCLEFISKLSQNRVDLRDKKPCSWEDLTTKDCPFFRIEVFWAAELVTPAFSLGQIYCPYCSFGQQQQLEQKLLAKQNLLQDT